MGWEEVRKPEPRGISPGPCTRWWAGHEAVVFGKDESVSRLVHTTRRYQPRPRSQVEDEGEQAKRRKGVLGRPLERAQRVDSTKQIGRFVRCKLPWWLLVHTSNKVIRD